MVPEMSAFPLKPEHVTTGARVLVVEDDTGVRRVIARMIEVLGYDVVAVADGKAAQRLPKRAPFDVVLADLRLPGTPGHKLVQKLRARWPDLRAIIMTGYAEDAEVRAGHRDGSWRILEKPFSFEALAAELRTLSGPGRTT
jgi:CheY-like chemotaxis protein